MRRKSQRKHKMHLWWAREEAWGCRNGMRPQKWFLLWGGGLPRGGACPHVSGGLGYEGVFPPILQMGSQEAQRG